MPEKEWTIPMGAFALLLRKRTRGGEVVSFAVILLAFHAGEWIDISRYDTAHGYPHRDVQGITEGLRGKLPLRSLSNRQAFRYAIRDFEQNAQIYLADFLAH